MFEMQGAGGRRRRKSQRADATGVDARLRRGTAGVSGRGTRGLRDHDDVLVAGTRREGGGAGGGGVGARRGGGGGAPSANPSPWGRGPPPPPPLVPGAARAS